MNHLYIFLGSGLGGISRYALGRLGQAAWPMAFPLSTMVINIIGSALMGAVFTWSLSQSSLHSDLRLFLTTGFLGGFTTFSAYSMDTITLWNRGDHYAAIIYSVGSVAFSLVALCIAAFLARRYL